MIGFSKKVVLSLIVVIAISSFFQLVTPNNILAQGTCSCSFGPYCDDNCDPGYSMQCNISLYSCVSCSCVASIVPSQSCNEGEIFTALGCIQVNTEGDFITKLIGIGAGIGGGIAFILILYSSFIIMTSAGDPRKLQAGKELLTAAIMGLLLLVLGAYLLRLIGVDLLGVLT